MTQQHTITIESPLGPLTLVEESDALTELHWGRAASETPTPLLQEAVRQLGEYFDKRRRDFDLPFAPAGSAFERSVWAAMSRIPYGQWRSYGDLAAEVQGQPQAVGAACGSNPLPILIPCHRVLAAEGRMGGYSGKGGLKTKQALLVLEGALLV
ncbi:MAG TPA: methylated-DNA--[protein]-cysteine S-methyltransferase [Stellaceae bacterium]|nr:methylated-DNA--[protein]-cysteine S-methyltransferase [Stellaceae bacterium]